MQPQENVHRAGSPRPGEESPATAPSAGLEPVIATLFSSASAAVRQPDESHAPPAHHSAPAHPEPRQTPARHSAPAEARLVLSARAAFIISVCLVALTAHSLGATWLGARVLFLPVGLWLCAAAVLLYELGPQRLRRAAMNFLDSADLLLGRILSRVDEESSTRLSRLGSRLGDACAAAVTPVIRPRIGIDLPGRDADSVLAAAHDLCRSEDVLWTRIVGRDHRRVSPSQVALLRRASDDAKALELIVPEHAGRKAVWWDWSQPLPLGYAAVFPPRLDPGHIRLPEVDIHDAGQVRLLVLLAQAAAAHAVASTRGFAERLRGGTSVAAPIPSAFDPEVATVRLAREFERQGESARRTPLFATTARLLSAWCVDPDYAMERAERTRLLQLCSNALPDEPEVSLRLATGYFAAHDDHRGLHTLLDAYEQLRERQGCFTDPLAFVFSEIETGRDSPLTTGRVAAGYALVWATAPEDRLPFLAADLADELRYATWLVGRDQDHRLLLHVIHELDRAQASQGTLWARDADDAPPDRGRGVLRDPDSRAA